MMQANWLKSQGVKKGDAVGAHLLHKAAQRLLCAARCLSATVTAQALLLRAAFVAHLLSGRQLLLLPLAGVYLPMICELPIAMLACARIGAMHTVVFAGFSAEALSQRLLDCK